MVEKINWDVYYMTQAFLIAQRSIDPSTKHGSIWVSKNNIPLSVGYNGPLRDIDDNKVPLTRPHKYPWLIHSEENCILSYTGDNGEIKNSKIYITGRPCHRCLRMIIQKGIKTIIYAGVKSKCIDNDDMNAQKEMLSLKPDIEIIEFNMSKKNEIIQLLDKTINYVDQRFK